MRIISYNTQLIFFDKIFEMIFKIFHLLFYITVILSKSRTSVHNDNRRSNDSSSFADTDNFVYFEMHQQIIQTVSDKFLSFSLDMTLLRKDMKNLPIDDEKFIKLTRHLEPAHLRIGGTPADVLTFNEKITSKQNVDTAENNINKDDNDNLISESKNISNITLTGRNLLSLNKFSQLTGTKILFDLNVLLRNSDGSWNSENPEKIILFAKARAMKFDWQLGNEPNSFHLVFNVTLSAKQLSEDYCKLRRILNRSGYKESILVGPEVNHITLAKGTPGLKYAEDFLRNIHDCIDYITWHQYYLHGRTATIEDFVDPKIFNRLPTEIRILQKMIETNGRNISMWISETSTASGGGAPELSDRYVAIFLWLDKLGVCARAGVQVVVRQTLLGGRYAMVGLDLEPNPDWWVSVLFKRLVSEKVLNLTSPDGNLGKIRLYAHCAASKSSLFVPTPQIIIYGMNMKSEEAKIRFHGLPTERTKASALLLTSDDLRSRNIILNGKVLKLKRDGSLPDFNPRVINISEPVELPAFSVIFLLLSDVESSPC